MDDQRSTERPQTATNDIYCHHPLAEMDTDTLNSVLKVRHLSEDAVCECGYDGPSHFEHLIEVLSSFQPRRLDVPAAALELMKRLDEDAFLCDFGGQVAVNLPNLDRVVPLEGRKRHG